MPETTLDKELDALKADFETLREEIASLAASVKNSFRRNARNDRGGWS